jgi:hypothetical protein
VANDIVSGPPGLDSAAEGVKAARTGAVPLGVEFTRLVLHCGRLAATVRRLGASRPWLCGMEAAVSAPAFHFPRLQTEDKDRS